jgi:hypothetical protein
MIYLNKYEEKLTKAGLKQKIARVVSDPTNSAIPSRATTEDLTGAGVEIVGNQLYVGGEAMGGAKIISNANNRFIKFPGNALIKYNGVTGVTVTNTGATGGTVTSDPVSVIEAVSGAKVTFQQGFIGQTLKLDYTIADFIPESATDTISVLVYLPDPSKLGGITFYLGTVGSFANNLSYSKVSNLAVAGWNLITFALSEASLTGAAVVYGTTAFNIIRIAFSCTEPGGTATVDSVWHNLSHSTKLMLHFDDGYLAQYVECFGYMSKKGIKGTIGVISSSVDGINRCSLAQLHSLYDAGWDLVNHTSAHQAFNSKDAGNTICTAANTLLTAGALFTLDGTIGSATFDTPRCLVFKFLANEQSKRFVITGLDENGLAVSENLVGFNAYKIASKIAYTKVVSIQTIAAMAGAVTVGQALSYTEIYSQILDCKNFLFANGFTRGSNLFISPQGEFNTLGDRALLELGYTVSRSVNDFFGISSKYKAGTHLSRLEASGGGGGSLTAAVLNSSVITALSHNTSLCVYLHEVIASGTPAVTQTLRLDFRAFIDAVAVQEAAGDLQTVTYSEFVAQL